MNNNNHSQNSSGPSPDDSLWAKIVDQQGQSHSENSETSEQVEQVELTSTLLDDLEFDRQLRTLAKISSPEDSFAEDVVAETHPDSSNSRLHVLKPSFLTRTSETVTETNLSSSTDEVVKDSTDSNPAVSSSESSQRRLIAQGAAPEIADSPNSKSGVTTPEEVLADHKNDSKEEPPEFLSQPDVDIDRVTAKPAEEKLVEKF